MKITYSFASRSRPNKFFAALDNIREMSANDNYEIIAKLDKDDPSINGYWFLEKILNYPEVKVMWGTSNNKVHAINRDLESITGDILCCHSDDMVFTKKGFDEIIRKEMKPGIYLHFPDGYANEKLCTYSIMHIDYYKRFGYIYHPEYKSLWCDNEQTEVAKTLWKYKYVDEKILEHMHPSAGKGQKDSQYSKTEKDSGQDKTTYQKRKLRNFDLPVKTLSVLICGLYDRYEELNRLVNVLKPQLNEEVEVKLCLDNKEATTGSKRNQLLESATGKYVVFIDDDDLIAETYIQDILQAAKQDTDAIVFKGWMTTNGEKKMNFDLSKDYLYTQKDNVYLRYPNHITPVRAPIAKQFKFPDKTYGEDFAWCTEIHKSGLIKTETKIDKELYFYLYKSK